MPAQTTVIFDELASRLRRMVREVHTNDLSGVTRFKVLTVDPFVIGELQGELTLEDGDPDFTMGEALRARAAAAQVAVGDLVWVARENQEWHAFDVVSR